MVAWLDRLANLASSVCTEVCGPESSHERDDATRSVVGFVFEAGHARHPNPFSAPRVTYARSFWLLSTVENGGL